MTLQRFRPIVQIFHISDLHFGPHKAAPSIRRRVPLGVSTANKGFAGHDGHALVALRRAFSRILASDASWRERSLIAGTGDFATWGDYRSHRSVLDYIAAIAARERMLPPFLVYGNHDVWGGGFPLGTTDGHLDNNRTIMRDSGSPVAPFPHDWPVNYSGARFPFATGEVRLLSLNTVQHESSKNWKALGAVRNDRYWEGGTRDQLSSLFAQSRSGDLHVVLSHHPVHHPDSTLPSTPDLAELAKWAGTKLGLACVLEDAGRVAAALDADPSRRCVVLSGHTHKAFPAFARLPQTLPASDSSHGPLSNRHLQLIAGTVSQESWTKTPPYHSWQLLRLYEDLVGGQLVLDRAVFSRPVGFGEFLPELDTKGRNVERLTLSR